MHIQKYSLGHTKKKVPYYVSVLACYYVISDITCLLQYVHLLHWRVKEVALNMLNISDLIHICCKQRKVFNCISIKNNYAQLASHVSLNDWMVVMFAWLFLPTVTLSWGLLLIRGCYIAADLHITSLFLSAERFNCGILFMKNHSLDIQYEEFKLKHNLQFIISWCNPVQGCCCHMRCSHV